MIQTLQIGVDVAVLSSDINVPSIGIEYLPTHLVSAAIFDRSNVRCDICAGRIDGTRTLIADILATYSTLQGPPTDRMTYVFTDMNTSISMTHKTLTGVSADCAVIFVLEGLKFRNSATNIRFGTSKPSM